ncbi:hypothetical protein ZIOFF_042694 [Zingiber officinale]|uniref:Plastid lipid-associated protein/fibrillin conserved domain-containing protein n=1 Tax=Zingiber officinale TaxID=94328 RepID=A0A8J5FW23_ZINOF|nr:hypothetical protein ZIOFF_042694 [Zingiber officinale]
MATAFLPGISHSCTNFPPPAPAPEKSRRSVRPSLRRCRSGAGRFRAMVQQQTFQGPPAAYAREMERLSAKESLLLAFKDAGGLQSLISGKTTEMQRIDVNERIVGLEQLNPTARPTTSPFLDGRWNFEWFSAGSPASFAARFVFERSPTTLANLLGLDMLLKDGYSKITANLRFLNSIESKFFLTTKLSLEGHMRMKEEYVEALLDTPTVSQEVVPEQLKGPLGQATGALEQLPLPIRDAFANGVKIPLSGTFQRLFIISYLDDEILITRNSAGAPDVLTRLESSPASAPSDTNAQLTLAIDVTNAQGASSSHQQQTQQVQKDGTDTRDGLQRANESQQAKPITGKQSDYCLGFLKPEQIAKGGKVTRLIQQEVPYGAPCVPLEKHFQLALQRNQIQKNQLRVGFKVSSRRPKSVHHKLNCRKKQNLDKTFELHQNMAQDLLHHLGNAAIASHSNSKGPIGANQIKTQMQEGFSNTERCSRNIAQLGILDTGQCNQTTEYCTDGDLSYWTVCSG